MLKDKKKMWKNVEELIKKYFRRMKRKENRVCNKSL